MVADFNSASLYEEIRRLADAKAVELGFSLETCEPRVLDEFGPGDEAFLEEQGISERRTLHAVNYDPNLNRDDGMATAGGDLAVYVHLPSRTVVAAWLGE